MAECQRSDATAFSELYQDTWLCNITEPRFMERPCLSLLPTAATLTPAHFDSCLYVIFLRSVLLTARLE